MKKNNRVGEINYNKSGEKMTITQYNNCDDIYVQFDNGHILHTQYSNFKRGVGKSKDDSEERLGEIKYNNNHSKMQIIEYNTSKNIKVKFEDGYTTQCTYQQFVNGEVANPYDKTILSVGYIGVGVYNVNINNKISEQYKHWYSMINRCYNKCYKPNNTYADCFVCEEWHNFQNFAKWFEENYYSIKDEIMCLDKDILIKGNKLYSPLTCVLVPKNINQLFIKSDNSRGQYPIGVTYRKDYEKFHARCCCNDGTREDLGFYNIPEEAFEAYREYKEFIIKSVAEKYRNFIPVQLYDALHKYKVEITD